MHRLNIFLSWFAPRSDRALFFFANLRVLTLTLKQLGILRILSSASSAVMSV
jgi:hypothetical protein